MKQLIRSTFAFFVLAVVSFAGTAHAQTLSQTIKAHIPFEFNVGSQTFPAGDYTITQPSQNIVSLRNERGQTITSVLAQATESLTGATEPALRFTVSGGQHRLVQVWQSGDAPTGLQLIQSTRRDVEAAGSH